MRCVCGGCLVSCVGRALCVAHPCAVRPSISIMLFLFSGLRRSPPPCTADLAQVDHTPKLGTPFWSSGTMAAYLSFNESFNSGLKFTTDNSEDTEDLLKKELPLRYTWAIWEQIMQSNDKSA
eukprot:9498202-Pyramimonas_sp.AAC.1